jgi:hypothetical protein
MDRPKKRHSGWCPILKGGRCHCEFKLANEMWDQWQGWLPDETEIRELCAQAYCADKNSKEILNPNLLDDITSNIARRLGKG